MDRPVEVLDREPVWRKAEAKLDSVASQTRNRPGRRLRRQFPQLENRNIGGGVAVGAVEAGIAVVLKDSLGLPLQSDVEIVDTEMMGGRTVEYTVNVDAPFENMARAEAFFDAAVGFTSLLTDKLQVEDVEVLKQRILRDTYQVKVLVED